VRGLEVPGGGSRQDAKSAKESRYEPASAERVQEANTAVLEVLGVVRDQGELMRLGGGGDQHIGLFSYETTCGELPSQFTCAPGDGL